jgi:hypothetical protein
MISCPVQIQSLIPLGVLLFRLPGVMAIFSDIHAVVRNFSFPVLNWRRKLKSEIVEF